MPEDQGAFANGSAAVIAQTLGAVDSKLDKLAAEQTAQRELLTRFDERQRGWATKHELADATNTLQRSLDPVAAQAKAAHDRLDGLTGSLSVLGGKVDALDQKIDMIREQNAQVQGAWYVGRGALIWVGGIAATAAAYALGHFL